MYSFPESIIFFSFLFCLAKVEVMLWRSVVEIIFQQSKLAIIFFAPNVNL
jgi:hypothetical protein